MRDVPSSDGSEATLIPAIGEALTQDDPPSPARGLTSVPARIGRFVVLDRLGAGGMGVVYAAYDPELDRKVAIKLMYVQENEASAARSQALLLREARVLAKLSHPNIVAIHDVGVFAGQVFVAMEFVAGRTVRRWLEEAPRTWQAIVEVFAQAGRGLMAAHEVGLVHRDVKPDNLLVGDDGRVRVADFGVARYRGPDEPPAMESDASRGMATVAGRGARIGTPAYMAPEQHENEGVGPHSDQFSFCVALHEALYRLRPFAGETPDALVAAIQAGEVCRPSEPQRVPGWLDRAVQRGLAARPSERWPSLSALLKVLTLDRGQRYARWGWRAFFAALAVIGAVGLYLGARELQLHRAREQAEETAAERLKVVMDGADRLLARGRRVEAEEALRAFVGEPEHSASRAALDAWLMWADRMDVALDREAALAALVEAYTGLSEGDPREATILLRIARLFHLQWRFDELATLARTAGQRSPQSVTTATWSRLRADAALAQRDVSGFLAEVDAGLAGREREDVAPVLRALNAASFPGVRGENVVPVDVVGDGARELLVFPRVGERGPASVRRMDRELSPALELAGGDGIDRIIPSLGALRRSPDGPPYVVGHGDGQAMLLELGAGEPRVVLAWPDDRPQAAAAADLDGDGAREFYVGTGPYTRNLYRLVTDAEGAWQREAAHPATDELDSDINALATGDFDGDGREELAVALGPWNAYDVRILQEAPDGGLAIGARRRMGHVRNLTPLRGADGALLLAIAKDNEAPSKFAFSPDMPTGEPAGLYVVRRRGDALETVFFAPLPAPGDVQEIGRVRGMERGDFDGDGRDDLVLYYKVSARRTWASTLLWRQREDGTFVSAQLEHAVPRAVGNFDDDAADELVVTTPNGDGDALAVLGAGGEPLASVLPPRVRVTPPAVSDPSLARVWARAEDLVGFGLYAAAADVLAHRSSLTHTAADGRAMQQRAAELYEAAGDHVRAAASYAALAQDGDIAAALASITSYERALELGSALRVARGVLGSDALTPSQRSEALAARDRLAASVERRDAIDLRFERPLAPSWRLHEPLALRLDRVRGSLAIDAFSDTGDLMTLPIDLSGGPLGVEVDLEVQRAEWGAQLAVSVRTPTGDEVMTLGVAAGGGGGYLSRYDIFHAPSVSRRQDLGVWPTDDPSVSSRHRLHVRLLPHQGVIDIDERGDHPQRLTLPFKQELRPGPHLLVLRADGVGHGAQQIRAQVRRIAVTGARLSVDAAPEEPGHPLARALVTGQWRAAATMSADDALAPLWRASAAAELGRFDDAITQLATLDPARPAIRRCLRHLLRAQPTRYQPLMRDAFGPRYVELLRDALASAEHMRLDPELLHVWLSQTVDVESLPASDPAQLDAKAELLTMRAEAWQAVGDLEQAAADVDAATALRPSESEGLAESELLKAEIAAARARPDEALAAATRAVARSRAPALVREHLRMDPRFQRMQADPRWRRLLDVSPSRPSGL